MNLSDTAKQSLYKMLEKSGDILSDAIDGTGKLVKENAKDLVREIIIYHGVIAPLISIISFILLQWFGVWAFNKIPTEGEDSKFYMGIGYTVIGVCSFINVAFLMSSIQDVFKAIFAPRLFLIEWAADLLKKDSTPESK